MNNKCILTSLLSIVISVGAFAQQTFSFGTNTNPEGVKFEVDSKGFVIGGKHVLPVMGELHYARVPEKDWRREILKMKAGGITVVATYCFWIHHEEEEGKWDWSGNKNLHKFLQICKEEGMPVVLRIGPFCHGEVYQGGFPVWMVDKSIADPKNYKLRSLAPGFMAATQRLYSNIYAQASDMMWKDGGPVVGVQIENECRGPWGYYMALKNMAVSIGFDTPFYTRTGWPKLNGNEEFGKMLPLYGDYADGFWDRVLTDMPGDYPKAFIFKDTRLSGVIATETFGSNQDTKMDGKDLQYPYLTCELGGGMTVAYHRRLNMSGNEPLPLAICKVGSGSNLPGYYMYHGGTNPYNPAHTMAECQASRTTAYNDLPHMSYDFQCPLGEMGQLNENAYHQTRWFHQFLSDWGEELSQMDVDSLSDNYARRGSFVFRNTYVRIINEEGVASVTPHNLDLDKELKINAATVQPFAKADGGYYFVPIKGEKPSVTVNGKKYALQFDRPKMICGKAFTALSQAKAKTAFVIGGKLHYAKHGGVVFEMGNGGLEAEAESGMKNAAIVEEFWQKNSSIGVECSKNQDAIGLRQVNLGGQKVAEQPSDADFDNAAIYSINVSVPDAEKCDDLFLQINYKGDVARVYADGVLVEDNFWNGKPMLVRMSSIVGKKVELRILPLSKTAPIYFQKEQKAILDSAPESGLLSLDSVEVLERITVPLDAE
ncbi:MAG: beta-galactosidase [Prevotellaceae bacterium]|nr:beta-galactosidase [Candidatus Minthosoma caballi]